MIVNLTIDLHPAIYLPLISNYRVVAPGVQLPFKEVEIKDRTREY